MVWPTEPIDGLDLERITDERKDVVKSEQREFTSCMAVRFCHSSRFRCFILGLYGYAFPIRLTDFTPLTDALNPR
jgi:hypothetical protein